MDISSNNDMNILDLPDEMLRAILNKLNAQDILYSLVDINQRFDRLVFDPLYIYHLDFSVKQTKTHNSSMCAHILDRISSKILPRINVKVQKLTVDPFSMKHIIDSVNYPQLHSLSLVNYEPDVFRQHVFGGPVSHLLHNQITNLTVDICSEETEIFDGTEPTIFEATLTFSRCLNDLTFFQWYSGKYITIASSTISHPSILSSTLSKLTININTLNDCLFLLNGCLPCLSTLIIRINRIGRSSSMVIDNTKKLVKLKCFSLTTNWYTYSYDQRVVPLLRRMLNLEKLVLYISVRRTESTYIDGNHLYDDVLNYMPRLNKFIFNIHTQIINYRIRTDLPSKYDIQNSFLKRGVQAVDISADDKLIDNRGNCHIYSLPYQFKDFLFMTSAFGRGRFDTVRTLLMRDERPFEHQLFEIISQDFPFLQELIIINNQAQQNEQHHSLTLITFHHLLTLNLINAHSDYAIQLLSDKITHLPCLRQLGIKYETLLIVTNYFTNDAIRSTCAQIKGLLTFTSFVRSQNFDSYFPSL